MILTLLMLCFSLVAHWLACVWFVIAEKEQDLHDGDWDIGKFVRDGEINCPHDRRDYVINNMWHPA